MEGLSILEEIVRTGREGVPAALAVVVRSSGSSPRKAGAKMLVRRDGSVRGTVGGGRIEAETVAAAVEAIGTGLPRTITFHLTEENGFVCGGTVDVFVDPVVPAPRLLVFGAGHVGRALAAAAGPAGFRVVLTDFRPGVAVADPVPGVEETIAGDPAEVLEKVAVDDSTFVVVATYDHGHDFEAVRRVLSTRARYIGLVGSRRKRELLLRTLESEGVPPEELGRISIPAGVPIGAETPAEIAVSILAQMIGERRGSGARERGSDPARGGRLEPDGEG